MANFVLIHGAYQGGWAWEKVAPILKKAGHKVFCPTLTVAENIGLYDHVNEVCSLLSNENLSEVILVGHSYAGMVITAVADKMPARLSQLIYIDALIPENDQSLLDIMNPGSAEQDYLNKIKSYNIGNFAPPKTAHELGLETAADINWATPQYTKQPLKTLTDKVNFNPQQLDKISKAHVFCQKSNFAKNIAEVFRNMAMKAKNSGWKYFALNTGHSCMITMPEELVAILLKII